VLWTGLAHKHTLLCQQYQQVHQRTSKSKMHFCDWEGNCRPRIFLGREGDYTSYTLPVTKCHTLFLDNDGSLLNRFPTAQMGHCCTCRKRWRLTDSNLHTTEESCILSVLHTILSPPLLHSNSHSHLALRIFYLLPCWWIYRLQSSAKSRSLCIAEQDK